MTSLLDKAMLLPQIIKEIPSHLGENLASGKDVGRRAGRTTGQWEMGLCPHVILLVCQKS